MGPDILPRSSSFLSSLASRSSKSRFPICEWCALAQEYRELRNQGLDPSLGRFFLVLMSSTLLVFALGLLLCFVRDPSILKDLTFEPSKVGIVKITWEDWKIGFIRVAIPQIPLSILNSVIAVCKLSSDLFPEKHVSPMAVSTSVRVMNLVGCWFGAMPVFHGTGGLAGQYKFRGRSGASVLFMGIGKLILGITFGNSFVRILSDFPIDLK